MTNKKNQQPTSTSTYLPRHDIFAQSVHNDNWLHIKMKHEIPPVVEQKRQVLADAKSQRKFPSTTTPRNISSSFELELIKVPLDLDYSVNRYLSYDDADAAPGGILARQITRACDTRKHDGHRGDPGFRRKDAARLLTQIGAWAIVDQTQQNRR